MKDQPMLQDSAWACARAAVPGPWDPADDEILDRAARLALGFRRALDGRPQRPLKSFAEMRRIFAGPLPELSRDGVDVIEELVAKAEPGLGAMAGARFFGWVMGASHPVGVAADWLTSAWGQNCGAHTPTPAAAACEEVAAGWLLDLFDLPRDSSVGFVTGATMANLTCLAAARDAVLRRVGWDADANGLFGAPPVRVIIGAEAHASVFSALQYLGMGYARVSRVATDAMGRMELAPFAKAMELVNGPTIVIAQAGQVNTGAFDPIEEIAELAHRRNAWVHVDGAFGLWARACPETAPLGQGLENADSWATDGHKWLQLPYDCGFAIMRDADAHRRAMTITASYLPNVAAGERNPSHLVPELSRRARGFAAWAMIQALGREGIAEMVARHCRIARRMAEALQHESGIRIVNQIDLNQVLVRFGEDPAANDNPGAAPGDAMAPDDQAVAQADAFTLEVINRVQTEGVCYAAGAQWQGNWVMRLSVISWPTIEEDADRSVAAIIAAWREVRAEAEDSTFTPRRHFG
jgi:glutamate/tyrosine decarboxylase-like PLP-dependent enzyme